MEDEKEDLAQAGKTALELEAAQTRRPISPGAEKWLGKPIPCLDKGFLYLVDYMGNDSAIVQSASPPRIACAAMNSAVEPVEQLLLTLTIGMPVRPSS